MMIPSKIFCCHADCEPETIATWGFWVANPRHPYDISYACNRHLGEMLPDDSSSHHTTPARINVWSLEGGYDGTMYSKERIEAARIRDLEGSPQQ